MKTKTISYSELSDKYVRNAVLLNNLPHIDDNWMYGFIVSPLLQQDIDEQQAENEKENGEDAEPVSIYDFAEGIYQTYIIDDTSALALYNNTSELISYSEQLDAFFWHVCHYGTGWTHVQATVIDGELADDEQVWDVTRLANLVQG